VTRADPGGPGVLLTHGKEKRNQWLKGPYRIGLVRGGRRVEVVVWGSELRLEGERRIGILGREKEEGDCGRAGVKRGAELEVG